VFLLRVVVLAPRKHHALAFVGESKMLRIPFAHLITIRGFEEDTADSKDAPALLHCDKRLRLFRLPRLDRRESLGSRGGAAALTVAFSP